MNNETDSVDENSNILVDEHLEIFDPNSDEEYVNKRGESSNARAE